MLLLVALTIPAKAQFNHVTHSARNSAMGGVFLYDLDRRQIAIDYRQDFMMDELADKSLCLVWPSARWGSVALDYCHHGNTDYHEQQTSATYALQATHWLTIGVEGHYLHLGTSDGHYQPQQWLAATVLLHANLSKSTTLDLIAGTRPWDHQRPYRLHLQTAYRHNDQWITLLEAESEDQLRVRLGMEYLYDDFIAIRAGLSTHPMTFTCGLGIRYKKLSFDLGVERHSTLGLTPESTLTLWF